MEPGTVYFVGAGPGDPALLTLKAHQLIAAADVIIYTGSLINPEVLHYARVDAALYNSVNMELSDQVALMQAAAARRRRIVRLHTGDPTIYGAILEQIHVLEQRGIPYKIVPGVSSALAAAAALGIELTVPGITQTVIFTRLGGQTPVPEREALCRLAEHRSSLVIFLSVGMLDRVVGELLAAGYAPNTPIAVVFRASWPDEQIIHGTLSDIVARIQSAEITHQALILVSPALTKPARLLDTPVSHLYGDAQRRPTMRQPTIAIITLTRHGSALGRRLHHLLPHSVLYIPARYADNQMSEKAEAESIKPYVVSVRQVLQDAFQQHSALVCIMSSGIVVRELAPLLRSKYEDAGVVVVDEQGRYAVSLLAGHRGGANLLARQVADLLGGHAVVTTASDVQEIPALDLLGHEYGWALERSEWMTAVCAALVNGDHVGVLQECGDDRWLQNTLPANFIRYASLADMQQAAPEAAVVITYRHVPETFVQNIPKTIIYHPRVLVVGVGCNRHTPSEEILQAIDTTFQEAGLARSSVALIATIEDKADEAGLLEACAIRSWPLKVYTRREIASLGELSNPSPWAQHALGVPGVAEPAALLGAATQHLLVAKRKFANVTVAVALREEHTL
ncbi:MAG: precorrin-4 C(11)-methyltransferase [Anaerolineae bacterium]